MDIRAVTIPKENNMPKRPMHLKMLKPERKKTRNWCSHFLIPYLFQVSAHHILGFLSLPLKITMGYMKFLTAGLLETVRHICKILTKILFFLAFLYSYSYQSSWNSVSVREKLFDTYLQTDILPTTTPVFIMLITFAYFSSYTSGGIKWTGRKILPNSPWNCLSSKLRHPHTFPHQI